jgi:tRNA-splicing ligase RtcB
MKKLLKSDLHPIGNSFWEIPISFRKDMRVPARVLSSESLLDAVLADRSLNQLVNVTTLPGIRKAALVMPDAHEGYGFPIGGVAATEHPTGVISPGGIGYDINCGVRLMVSDLRQEDIRDQLEELSRELYAQIPSGMGKGGHIQLSLEEMDEVLTKGAEWAVDRGYGVAGDLAYIESHGRLAEADPGMVSERAKQRGSDQLGTIGSGNHFVEVDYVTELFDDEIATAYGLEPGQVVVLIHTGSRGLGHQIATDNIRQMMAAMPKYDIQIPDRELACVPFDSEEGQAYYKAMCAAANYAWCNRQIISWEVQKAWDACLGKKGGRLRLLYDVAHNIAKLESYQLGGENKKLIVHRKGATRAFGPEHPELPAPYRTAGQPVLIPGSMGTSSFVLAGTSQSYDRSFGSCCHGAGRRLSRSAAKRQVNAPVLKEELKERGIFIEAGSFKGIAEEAPVAYKDVNLVVDAIEASGIAKRVARLVPVAVIKG